MDILLTENSRFGTETGAGLMRNRCAFTSRDMAADWGDAFTYAIVLGWHDNDPEIDAMGHLASKWDWDDDLIAFLVDAHDRFRALRDKTELSRPE